jgi:hypothetical protein
MRSDSGSIFVESMVAAAVIALALAAMYQAIGDGAMRNRKLHEKQMALLVAQSEMAAIGSEIPVASGTTGGTSGAFAWRVDIEPFNAETDASQTGDLWVVTVAVGSAEGGTDLVRLQSLALSRGS